MVSSSERDLSLIIKSTVNEMKFLRRLMIKLSNDKGASNESERYFSDFDKLWTSITNRKNFSLARYADGEVMLMMAKKIGEDTQAFATDKWSAPSGLSEAGRDLFNTLECTDENFYYAISAPSDSSSDFEFLRSKIKQEPKFITFANIWINANYERMLEKYRTLQRDVTLICNERGAAAQFPFPVKAIIPFPDNCVNYWQSSSHQFLDTLTWNAKEANNQLYFIACGPISAIIVHRLHRINSRNTYIDIGSSLDEFIHGRKTRPYMDRNSTYAQETSTFG